MELQCEYSVNGFTGLDNEYCCKLTSPNVTKPSEVTSCTGIHLANRSNQDVKALWIQDSVLHYLPSGFDKLFPQLAVIYIIRCGLKEISAKELKGLEHLEVLYLPGNHLTSVPNDLFIHTKKMRWIDFDDNRLEAMNSQIFDPIPEHQLEYVDLRRNTKIDVRYEPGSNGGLKSFDELKEAIDSACQYPNRAVKVGDSLKEIESLKQTSSFGFEKLWKLKKFSDFTIVVGEKEFPVHKNVLAAQSSVFASLLETDEAVKTSNKLEIKDCSEECVEEFLRALYTGEIEADDDDKWNALDLFSLACTFELPQLKELTEVLVIEELDDENAVKALTVGSLFKSDKIIDAACARIKRSILNVDLSTALKKYPEHSDAVVRAIKGFKEALDNMK